MKTGHNFFKVNIDFEYCNDIYSVDAEPYQTLLELKEIIKSHHVERLQEGDCGVQGGVALFDLINCYERIAAHASNIALHVVKRTSGDKEFDEMHGHVTDTETEEYIALEKYYEQKYIEPVKKYTKKKKAEKSVATELAD